MSDAATTPATPNAMPGVTPPATTPATPAAPPAAVTSVPPAAPATGGLNADERAELERLRNVHKDEQKYRREATEKHGPAEAYANLLQSLGVDPTKPEAKDFDAKSAFTALEEKFNASEKARIRERVARTEGVDPEDFSGSTEDEMRASAKRFKDRIAAEVAKLAPTVEPSAAPATTVTSSTPIDGPKPIASRDELKKMTREERMKAHKEGRLDDLAAGRT